MKRAFTLIELLIVIAIIAILALIAIPNFLESQARARVSRCLADMRSLATATEAYTVDYNRAEIGFNEGVHLGLWDNNDDIRRGIGVYAPLTTPIAYITNPPFDAFIEKASSDNNRKFRVYFYDYYARILDPTPGNNASIKANKRGYFWLYRSWGPSRKSTTPWEWEMLSDQTTEHIYDPTNGTVSDGVILYTNRGLYKGPKS